eukprot:3999535-Pyramimonas_sp.AAC.1
MARQPPTARFSDIPPSTAGIRPTPAHSRCQIRRKLAETIDSHPPCPHGQWFLHGDGAKITVRPPARARTPPQLGSDGGGAFLDGTWTVLGRYLVGAVVA